MSWLIFIIGLLAGATGAAVPLFIRYAKEIRENMELRVKNSRAFGSGYQAGWMHGVKKERERWTSLHPFIKGGKLNGERR